MPQGTWPQPGCDTADAAEGGADQLNDHGSCVVFHNLSACPSAWNIGKKVMLYSIVLLFQSHGVVFQTKSLHVFCHLNNI